MTRPAAAATRRSLGRLLGRPLGLPLALLLALLVPLMVLPPAESAHATGPAPLQVPGGEVVAQATLTGVDPAFVTGPDDLLTLRGVLRNVSDSPLLDPLPALRLSRDALQSADDLALLDANDLFRYGRVDYDYTDPLPTLPAGGEAPFTIQVPLDSLVPGPGVYVVGVDVLGTLPGGPRVFVASARTTVPVRVTTARPLATALLWPLAAAPSLLPDGTLTDDELAAELSPGGRLDALVQAGEDAPLTWVVDPDLLATASAMTGGYRTVDPPGPGAGDQAAADFLDLLADTIGPPSDPGADGGSAVYRLPTADPDVGGMTASGLAPERVRAILAASAGTLPASVVSARTPLLADLVQRAVDQSTLQAYADAAVATVVLDADDVQSDDAAAVAPLQDVPGTTVVRASPLVTGASDDLTPALAARQRLLSETALLAETDADGVVLAPPLQLEVTEPEARAVVTAWQDAPWVKAVTLGELTVSDEAARLVDDLPAPEPLDPSVVGTIDELAADLVRLEPLFASPPVSAPALLTAQARAFSAQFADDPAGAAAYVDALAAGLAGAESRLGVVMSPTITLSSRSGRFPVTIVNDSGADVLVGLSFESQNSTRLRVEDVSAAVLSAGEKRTVSASAIATANGRVVVTARLVTSQGDPVGDSATTIVDVTNVGALGWAVIAAGGVLMLVALARNRRSRRRPGTPEPGPDAAGRPPPEDA